jgi:predicted TIM-barrel fold metal-dependent hydrolase
MPASPSSADTTGLSDTEPYASLRAEIGRIPCINSHSHLMPEAQRLATPVDALSLFGHAYPAADLRSAGMTQETLDEICDLSRPLALRWERFAPYWQRVRLTGYSRCLRIGFEDLLGFADLTADTVGPLSAALAAHAKPGFYGEILRKRANIRCSVVNMEDLVDVDRELFLPLPRLNRFSMLRSADQLQAIEADYAASITSLADHVALIDRVCQDWKRAGVAGIKLSQSYHRRMDFEGREPGAAVTVFAGLLRGDYDGLESPAGRLLEDYLVFECCRAASEADLTIQFHQGMRAGNYGGMEGASPAPLAPLMQNFRNARFDLSHAGFPYLREGAVLGKTFPNVYLNMSWIHIISPFGARLDLREWLEMVPTNKIIAFGDDLAHAEAVYGHAQMARDNFAYVLTQMIQERRLSESEAVDVARAAFHDNPAHIYNLDGG